MEISLKRGSKFRGPLLNEPIPCLIEDMSHGGFLLVCSEPFEQGQILNFSCELLPEQQLDCNIQVMHQGDSVLGAKIVEIDDKGIEMCKEFLRTQIAMRRLKDSLESVKSAFTDPKEDT